MHQVQMASKRTSRTRHGARTDGIIFGDGISETTDETAERRGAPLAPIRAHTLSRRARGIEPAPRRAAGTAHTLPLHRAQTHRTG